MAGKSTDRKGKGKETKAPSEIDTLATFTLPDSLPCSEIELPVLTKKTTTASWNAVLAESDEKFREIAKYVESKQEQVPKPPFLSQLLISKLAQAKMRSYDGASLHTNCPLSLPTQTECDYIQNEVFVYLIPALEKTLTKAKIWEALLRQKCFFNGIDHIVQLLWNNNPRYPGRKDNNLHLFNMPWIRKHLEINPRPYYPKSWLWPEEYAATLIQKTIRQYFIQREDEVQEMREFWKKLELERHVPDLETNPFLAKKFATEHNTRKSP